MIDRYLVEHLNALAVESSWSRQLATWAATDLVAVFIGTLVLGGLVAGAVGIRRGVIPFRLIEGAVVALFALGIGLLLNHAIGAIWFRERPFVALPDVRLLVPRSNDPSFPSDHATAAFALAIGIGLSVPWLRNVLLVEACAMVTGRVAVGLHFPSDILGGLCIALLSVSIAVWLVSVIRPVLLGVSALVLRPVAQVTRPEPQRPRQVDILLCLGISATLLGLPVIVETAVDPIRLGSPWIEDPALTVCWLGLGVLTLFVIRVARLDPRKAGPRLHS